MEKIIITLKNVLRPVWLLYCRLSFRFVVSRVLSDTYISEIEFFLNTQKSRIDDIKYLEQQLRYYAHQIDKTLTLDTPCVFKHISQTVYAHLHTLETRGITDSPTVVWAHEVMRTYEKRALLQHGALYEIEKKSKSCSDILPEAVFNLIKTRRSIRSYCPQKIPPEIIKKILETGLCAPSGCNRQNIEFLLLEHVDDILFCKKIAGEPYGFPLEASCGVVVLLDCRSYILPNERHMAYLEGGAAIQNMLLYAHSLGIGSVWLNWGGLENKNSQLREKYELAGWHLPVALVCFGYTNVPPPVITKHKAVENSIYIKK